MEVVNKKSTVYIGGLDENVTEELLKSAFITFGNIESVMVPIDHKSQKSKGFGFVQFETAQDASDAIDNMHDSEILGRVIKCVIAKPVTVNKNKALWSKDQYHTDSAGELVDEDSVVIEED
ncbi:hypothetical protein DLAC_00140 [Tieghemostelium lacteum]|uniref:RRM domain-containing protein n=1 Tax=Tieghemostelium lacteum TaxID=361077 RepID=A0A152A976_TIELA|nr:hypothetical protein DLAC_00140 [Tieghemostelium lacteum]|eukprot:KYR02681.1 hypothetical protein DLAC_00140 [Tieghemostelium lacteum]